MSGWTPERIERLNTLWQEGLSASQVAKLLGGVTRNAVLSKVHRLGIAGRATASAPSRPARPPRRDPAPRVARPKAAPDRPRRVLPTIAMAPPAADAFPAYAADPSPLRPPVEEGPGSATIMTLGRNECSWPIGDPQADDFTLCGAPAGGRYCQRHAALAYQPAKKKHSASELARSLRRYI